jgi:hypothetical protein
MATWQQNISAGGLLAGIGQVNSNAPSVHDADRTAAYIRQNNELERSGANNIGLTALLGANSVADILKQQQQAERQKQFQQDYANTYASGDKTAMRQLAVKYPDQFKAVQSGLGFIDDDHRQSAGSLAASAKIASQSPEAMQQWLSTNAGELQRLGVDPSQVAGMYQQNPQGFGELMDHLGMAALSPKEYYDTQDKMTGRGIQAGQLVETSRSNQANEYLKQRGQDITAETARRGQDLSLQRAGMANAGNDRTVQLPDGRTVNIGGKVHGSGANAFYEGMDDNGNVIRVPASSISTAPSGGVNANNYAMKSDIEKITNSNDQDLNFITGVTGGTGKQAFGADVRSRISGKDQRQIFNAANRIQGRMQNQGVQAARDMGASGINTVEEAKMYFQSMPQIDYSSPKALKDSITTIKSYTDNYNKQYNVTLSGENQSNSQTTGQTFTTKSGISFKVE